MHGGIDLGGTDTHSRGCEPPVRNWCSLPQEHGTRLIKIEKGSADFAQVPDLGRRVNYTLTS